MRYSEKIYNNLINRVRTSSDISIFEYPKYEVSGMSNDLSLPDDTSIVHVIDRGGELPIDITFDDETQFTRFSYDILPLNTKTNTFNALGSYTSEPFAITGLTHQSVLLSDKLHGEGEFILKTGFEYNVGTQIGSIMGKNRVTTTYGDSLPYGHFDKNNDKYFVMLYKPDEPILEIARQATNRNEKNRLDIKRLTTKDGVNKYNLRINKEGELLIFLNGFMLTQDEDYTFSGGIIEFAEPLRLSDMVNYVYVGKDNTSGLRSEILSIDEKIEEGPTDGQGNNYIYHNNQTNRYELYTEYEIDRPDSVILALKGRALTNNVDFFVSKSNSRRIILVGDVFVGDWFNVIYDSGKKTDVEIYEDYFLAMWHVNNQSLNGEFIVELSKSKSFDVVEESYTIPYKSRTKSYMKRLELNYDYGTDLYYRVKNVKTYTTLSGKTIEVDNVSETVKLQIKTNLSNNY